jgi:hypothetical protein
LNKSRIIYFLLQFLKPSIDSFLVLEMDSRRSSLIILSLLTVLTIAFLIIIVVIYFPKQVIPHFNIERYRASHSQITDVIDCKSIVKAQWCINLDRRPDRWEDFQKRVPSCLSVQRFSAVDAKNIEWDPNDPFESILPKKQFGEQGQYRGEIGCLLSHYRLW